MNCLASIDVIILAGGKGTRLASVFPQLPKPLVPVRGRPFLAHQIDWVRSFGARRVHLAVGYRHEAIREFVEANPWTDVSVDLSVESEPLGTGGALALVLPRIGSDTVMVLNGDSFTRVDLCAFLEFHERSAAEFSLVASRVEDVARYGEIRTDDGGRVLSIEEKPPGDSRPGFVNSGIYLLDRRLLAAIPSRRMVSLEREVLPGVKRLYAMKGIYPFIDLGTPESYARAEAFFEPGN